jgi:DNA polymerase III, delta subunit
MRPDQVHDALRGDLPPVVLLVGPGSFQLAVELAGRYDTVGTEITNLSAENARFVAATAHMAPAFGAEVRPVVIVLDGASDQALNVLLKVLEEPPPPARFILCALRRPIATIVSRAQLFALGPDGGEPPDDREVRGEVTAAVKAALAGQSGVLGTLVRAWTPQHTSVLGAWAAEASSGRWERYRPESVPGVSGAQALRILEVLTRYAGARTAAPVALLRVLSPG